MNPAQPGLKIAFNKGNVLAQFPDAFKPYQHFGCDFSKPYDGTLFRFPLRSEHAAASSDIKPSPCTPEQVMSLLESFKGQLPRALLFLKNVRSVAVYTRASPDAPAELLYRAAAESDGKQVNNGLVLQLSLEFLHIGIIPVS